MTTNDTSLTFSTITEQLADVHGGARRCSSFRGSITASAEGARILRSCGFPAKYIARPTPRQILCSWGHG